MCNNQNCRRMKTTLLVVGRTVKQHYITAINDYIQRTKRYITFDMEVIPELKNTKSCLLYTSTPSLEGYPVGAIFALKTKGINPDTGQIYLENKEGKAVTVEELFRMTSNEDGLGTRCV